MWPFNRVLGGLFELLLFPFRELPPIVGLAAISLPVSIALLLGFKATSDQEALAAVKRRIHAGVFEIRLFKDDLRAIFSAQAGILRHTLTYFRLSMVPMTWMLVPMVLVVIQLQFRYGYEGLEPGRNAIVKVSFTDEGAERLRETGAEGLSLETPPGIRVETPLLWIPSLGEADWRIAAERSGDYEIVVRVAESSFTKSVRVSDAVLLRSPVRPSRDFFGELLYPAESPLPGDAPVASITINYPEAEVSLLGWETHWLIAFFILTMLFAFALQRPLKVKL